MPTVHEQLSQQFHEWEIRGRGWQTFNEPVFPEPPFVPFHGHFLPDAPVIDDGRRPTILSSLFRKLSGQTEPPPISPEPIDDEPQPEVFERDSIVELHASLPPTANISKEVFEQFVLSLANCSEPIAFELIGTHDNITVQLVTSLSDVDLVRQQLEAHFPEAVFIKQISSFLETKWNEVDGENAVIFEFGLSREFMFQIATARNFNIEPYIGLIGALSNLRQDELALFQVIFQPVREAWDESILRSVTDGSGKDFFVNRPELSGEAKKENCATTVCHRCPNCDQER